MAFQAGTNPPGGIWQDDDNPNYEVGKSIMATKSPSQFISFMSSFTVCFACSAMQFIVLLDKSSGKTWSVFRSFLYFTMGSAISSIVVAYWSVIKALTPDAQDYPSTYTCFAANFNMYREETTYVSLEIMLSYYPF
ncbi:unnamed protein product [Citrullus colocynthis]|uniref:PGG domain-containing protein n=1 Tax=Citrullus colocynthis TaxID=252529 RepID=A0ABP0Y377_9ROSI